MSSKYLDIERVLTLISEEDILAQIKYRKNLMSIMVGRLYPSILDGEINKLYDHLRSLGFEVNDEDRGCS